MVQYILHTFKCSNNTVDDTKVQYRGTNPTCIVHNALSEHCYKGNSGADTKEKLEENQEN